MNLWVGLEIVEEIPTLLLCSYRCGCYFVRVQTGVFRKGDSPKNSRLHSCSAPHVQLLQDNHVCWRNPQVAPTYFSQAMG